MARGVGWLGSIVVLGAVMAGAGCGPPCGAGTVARDGRCVAPAGVPPVTWSANRPVAKASTGDLRVEPSVAVGPSGRVYVAFITEPGTGTPPAEIQLAVRDPGATAFAPPVTVDLSPLTPGGTFLEGDPTALVDPAGRFHLAWAEYHADAAGHVTGDIAATWSDDGGRTFAPTVRVNAATGGISSDRPWLAATADGTLYLSWISEDATHAYERIATSSDGGRTFVELTPIDQAQGARKRVLWNGPVVATSPRALVLAGYVYQPDGSYLALTLMRSTDGGQTWQAQDLPGTLHPAAGVSVNPRPLLVRAADGTLYLAYVDAPNGRAGVFVMRSGDDGRHFSAPLAVSAAATTAPSLTWMAPDAAGEAHLVWLDPAGGGWRVRYRGTTGGGTALSPTAPVSDVTFPGALTPTADPRRWLGDYLGFVLRDGRGYAAWTDTRGGHSDVYLAEAPLP